MKNIVSEATLNPCIRVDMSEGDIFLDEDELKDILEEFTLDSKKCRLMIDLGYLSENPEGNIDNYLDVYKKLQKYKFNQLIITGSSMPRSITKAATKQHSEGSIDRIEMTIWKGLIDNGCDISFGDYGVRHPKPEPEPENSDDTKGPFYHNRNTQIRYTVPNKHIIFRGCPAKNEENSQQKLAIKLTSSDIYAGTDFSWGDQKIHSCSKGEITGNSSSWIAFETSRHIAFIPKEMHAYLESKVSIEVVEPEANDQSVLSP